MVVRELITRLGFKVDEGSAKKGEQRIQKMKGSMKKLGLSIGAAVIGVGALAIKAASDMEMLTTQFEVMLGSSEKAAGMMKDLNKFAASTPFALEDLAKGSQNLLAFGVSSDKVVDTMRMLGDTAGGNAEKLQGLVLAYGKVQTKGKASMEEINMLAERGVPIIGTLQKQLGVTNQEFFKMVSAGKITKKEVTQAFRTMTSEGGMFYKGMEKQSLTFSGMVSTMKDNIKMMLASVGSSILPLLKSLTTTITGLVQGPLGEVIKSLVSTLVPILGTLQKILDPIFAGLQPILEEVMGFVGDILVDLMPIIDLIRPLLQIVAIVVKVLKVIEPIIKLVGQVIGFIATLLDALMPTITMILDVAIGLVKVVVDMLISVLLDLLKSLMPLIMEITRTLNLIIPLLLPILEIIIKLSLARFLIQIKLMLIPIKLIIGLLSWILKWINNFAQWFFNLVQKPVQAFWNWLTGSLDWFFGKLGKLAEWLGLDMALPSFGKDQLKRGPDASLKKQAQLTGTNNQNNINIEMNQSINTGGLATGTTTGDVKKATEDAVRATFGLELRKVLVGA